jgi:hypothetical protein
LQPLSTIDFVLRVSLGDANSPPPPPVPPPRIPRVADDRHPAGGRHRRGAAHPATAMKLFVPDTRHRESCTSKLYVCPEIKNRSVRGSIWEACEAASRDARPVVHHPWKDFPLLLKTLLRRRKGPVASVVLGLPTLPQPPLPGLLALGASGERGRALGRSSERRSVGCGGASAGKPPLRAARTPTCCARGPSLPNSLHEHAATRAAEANASRPPADTTLIPPGAQNGATRSNPQQGNQPRNAGFANLCTPLQHLDCHP